MNVQVSIINIVIIHILWFIVSYISYKQGFRRGYDQSTKDDNNFKSGQWNR